MIEVDAGLRVLDKFIELLKVGDKAKKDYFDSVVQPMFEDAELVAKDYIALFGELIAKLKKGQDVLEMTGWIEERRLEFLPVRIKVRALLEEGCVKPSMDRFEQGIWGLLKGGISLVEEGHAPLREYGFGSHTVLDLLKRCSNEPLERRRELLLRSATAQLTCIQAAWKDTVKGYGELRRKAHPRR
jgi:hypothetical protein